MGKRSAAPTPTPRGNTLDGQLRLSYRQVLRNGAMGIDQCAFMGTHFGCSSSTVRKSYAALARGKGTVDEETFLGIMEHAMANTNFRASERVRMINKNSAVLHKELAIGPFAKLPVVLPRAVSETTSPRMASPHRTHFDPLSPSSKQPTKQFLHTVTASQRLDVSEDRDIGTSTPMMSPARGRSHSVPPMTPRGLDSSIDEFKRPGSAMYLKPYTPRRSLDLPVWKWNQLDNNVPRNIRNVLLKPMKYVSRPVTSAAKSPELTAVLSRMKAAMRGITRMEAIQALTKSNDGTTKKGPISLLDVVHGFQMLGLNMTDTEARLLAEECKAVADDGNSIKPLTLTNAVIPLAETLSVADVGIEPKSFTHFKHQRLSFTHALSNKEVKLLELVRLKLSTTCQGGPADLRKAFKLVDETKRGRCNFKEMVTAFELQGIGMSQTDAEVLYLILDPDGRGMDYNAFTAMMMPPDIAEAQSQVVMLGYIRNESKSRQGLRDRQTGKTEKSHKKSKPDPGEVERFMSRLTPDNVIQILKNRVALALKAGPGAIRKWFALFDKDGNSEIDEAELKDLMVDFGLNLSTAQISALMKKIDANQNGLLDPGELIAALLPADQFSLTASTAELKDPFEVGCPHGTGTIHGKDLRNFLRDKLIRAFVKKGDKQSTGYQIREAISRFDTNRDGSMSKIELRKAMNGLGLSVDNEMLNSLIACYQDKSDGGEDSVAYSKFVEDVDPTAFNYAFSAGLCSTSGSFDKIEKEAVVSNLDPPEKIRNTLKATLKARMKTDGISKIITEIMPYGDSNGVLTQEAFRAMLLRLGLKIDRLENLRLAYQVFANKEGVCDVWTFASMAEADFERVPLQGDKARSPRDKKIGKPRTAAASRLQTAMEKKQIGVSTIVEPKPFA